MFLALQIAFVVLQFFCIVMCVRGVRRSMRRTMYSYKNISLIGGIIFFAVSFIANVLSLVIWPYEYEMQIYHVTNSIITSFTGFANIVTFFVLPPLGIFLIISNIVLLKKEGKSLPNLLGILLCFVLIFGSATVFYLYDILDQFFNVHSYAGYCISLWLENLFAIIVCYFECLFFATIYVSFKARRHVPKFDKDYMIILGCRTRDDGKPASLLRKRIDRAREFAKLQEKEAKKELIFVPSGGQGADEPLAEAISMKNYLLEKRVPKKNILVEDESKTTLENFRFSKKIINTTEHVAFSTSSYHVFRAGVIATQAGFETIEGIGSKSPWYYHISALIREFIANLHSEKQLHIRNLTVLIVFLTIYVLAGYFLDIL